MKDSKYEEALERARQGMPIDEVFPELKESEDERIRKAIEGTIRVYGKTQGEWLCGYDMDTLVVHLREAFGALEKQKEQKPALRITKGFYEPDGPQFDIVEQQPAEWSEEDNEKIKRLRSIVNDCAFRNDALDVNGDYCEGDYEELDNWLKSLRPQPKQEWNWDDEDFEKFRDVLAKKAYLDEITSIKVARKLLGFLKHYHPQPHWKPSEEQIEALTYATGEGGKYNKAALKSLYEDLKSL